MIEIKEDKIKLAATQGMDAFIRVFTDAYRARIAEDFTLDRMEELNGSQHTLLAYSYFVEEINEGGFCQLIQNGYGPYIFDNPFAKAMRLWGLKDFSKLIYSAKEIYDANKEDLTRERTDEEFMAMYEAYEAFDKMEESFLEDEESITTHIATYVDDHLEEFAKIIKE